MTAVTLDPAIGRIWDQRYPMVHRLFVISPVGPAATGVLIAIGLGLFFTALCLVAWAAGDIPIIDDTDTLTQYYIYDGLTLIVIAYLLAAGEIGRRGFARDLGDLKPDLAMSPEAFEGAARSVFYGHKRLRLAWGCVFTAFTSVATMVPVLPDSLAEEGMLLASFMVVRVVVMFWLLSTMMFDLTRESVLISWLSERHLVCNLMAPSPCAPIARLGMRNATVVLVGIIVALPLLIDPRTLIATIAILMLVMGVAIAALLLPAFGVRRAVVRAKQKELKRLEPLIADAVTAAERAEPQAPEKLGGLMAYRDAILRVHEWPFTTPTLVRFALLMTLALGSWMGGALVERALDVTLG